MNKALDDAIEEIKAGNIDVPIRPAGPLLVLDDEGNEIPFTAQTTDEEPDVGPDSG